MLYYAQTMEYQKRNETQQKKKNPHSFLRYLTLFLREPKLFVAAVYHQYRYI